MGQPDSSVCLWLASKVSLYIMVYCATLCYVFHSTVFWNHMWWDCSHFSVLFPLVVMPSSDLWVHIVVTPGNRTIVKEYYCSVYVCISAEPVHLRTPTRVPCLMTPGSLCHRAGMLLGVSGARPQSPPPVGGTPGPGTRARRQPRHLAGDLVLQRPPCPASAWLKCSTSILPLTIQGGTVQIVQTASIPGPTVPLH